MSAAPDVSRSRYWDALVLRYERLVWSVVTGRFGLGRHDAEDAYQSTWLIVIRKGRIPPEEEVVRYLAATAAWTCRGLRQRTREEILEPAAIAAIPDCGEPLPEEYVSALEEQQIVQDAFAELSARDQELLRSLFLSASPLDYAQMAALFEVSLGSVGPLRSRALERLREGLRRRGFPDA